MTHSSVTCLSLISRIRKDDGVAWTELVELYSPLVVFWCRRQGIAENDVNDLSQEIFFAVSRSIERYRPTGLSGSFRAWLWSLTRHKMIDGHRRQRRQPIAQGGSSALLEAQNIPELIQIEDPSERSEFNHLVHRALDQVRPEFEPRSWQAFWRSTIDGLTVSVVAEQLDMNSANVRQHRSRILRRLREQLGELE